MMDKSVEAREAEELDHHPQPRQYVKIAIFLAIVTALEVAIYYVDCVGGCLVPLLLAFAGVKFMLVALWFMHLRFDSRIFRRFFVTGIILALTVFAIVLWIFFTHSAVRRRRPDRGTLCCWPPEPPPHPGSSMPIPKCGCSSPGS